MPGQPGNFVFPVAVALDKTAMKIDNATIPLTAGMTVTVEIRTDFSPRHRLPSLAAGQNRIRGTQGEVAGPDPISVGWSTHSPGCSRWCWGAGNGFGARSALTRSRRSLGSVPGRKALQWRRAASH